MKNLALAAALFVAIVATAGAQNPGHFSPLNYIDLDQTVTITPPPEMPPPNGFGWNVAPTMPEIPGGPAIDPYGPVQPPVTVGLSLPPVGTPALFSLPGGGGGHGTPPPQLNP